MALVYKNCEIATTMKDAVNQIAKGEVQKIFRSEFDLCFLFKLRIVFYGAFDLRTQTELPWQCYPP